MSYVYVGLLCVLDEGAIFIVVRADLKRERGGHSQRQTAGGNNNTSVRMESRELTP